MKQWMGALLLALNQLGNAILGGDPGMAISARAGLAREAGSPWAGRWCHVLDWIDPRDGDDDGPRGDHCTMSVQVYYARQLARAAEAERRRTAALEGGQDGSESRPD